MGRPLRRLTRRCLFELQDRVALGVAGVIEPALQAAETARSAGRQTSDLAAHDLYLRASAIVLSSAEQLPQALSLLEQAIARDHHYGPALVLAAICCKRLVMDGRSRSPETERQKGTLFAQRALAAAGDDPGVLADAALALANFGKEISAMIALVDRALALNPSFARGWYISGILRVCAGQPHLAVERAEASLRLSPRGRIGVPFLLIGVALFFARRFDEALPKLQIAIQEVASYREAYRCLAACYAHIRRLDDARAIVARLRAITLEVVPPDLPLRNPEDRELFLAGLRPAASEE